MFRTELKIEPSLVKIDHSQSVVTMGSCFAQVIGEKLFSTKFNTLSNPFGTIFNPISIFNLLQAMAGDVSIPVYYPVQSNEQWFNLHSHSDLHGNTEKELNEKFYAQFKKTEAYLKKSNVWIITLGTSFVYRFKSSGQTVANCHKLPGNLFTKEMLNASEIVSSFSSLKYQLKESGLNPLIVLTVSPVRHIKDTLILNSVSKAILRDACYQITEMYKEVSYFPSYEIMMDDLRDYRFYKEDMIHPNEVAEKYIWNKFSETFFNKETQELIKQWDEIKNALSHKPFHPESESYKLFLESTLQKLESIGNSLKIQEEIKIVQEKLNAIKK